MSTQTVEFSGIELLSPCPHCSAPIAVNTLTDRCRCSSCHSESALPPSVWDEALGGVERDVVQFAAGYLRHGPEWGEGGVPPGPHVEWLRGHETPPCPRCRRTMRLSPHGGCFCPGCGATRPIYLRPAWLPAQSPVVGFVSEEPAGAAERPAEPVHVACTQCGGPLVADGSSRIVPCGYCATRVALPDAVWTALHPPRVKRRWWLVVRVDADPRRGPASVFRFTKTAWWLLGILIVAFPYLFFLGETVFRAFDAGAIDQSFIFAVGPLVLFFVLWLRGRWLHWRICRPEHEVVGRLSDDSQAVLFTPVLVTPPHQPTTVLARSSLWNVSPKQFAQLGGSGGKIRAWVVPGKPRLVHVEPIPSVLE